MKNLPGYIIGEKNVETRKALKDSLLYEASHFLTICEQLRFILDTVLQIKDEDIKNDLTEKLVDALNMGKKMNARLAKYKRDYNDKTGSAGSNLILLEHTKEREEIRKKRKI